jgi:hypothetical protein
MRSSSPDDTVLTPHGLNSLKSDLLGYCLALETKGRVQEIELANACREAEEARTHAVILGRQYTDVQNAKKKTRTSGTFDAQARVMNTDEAMLILQNEEDACLAELARIEALEAGYQHCLELQILNAPRFLWFHATATIVIDREKAIVATEKAAVKATENAAKEAKAAAAKVVNAARRLEEKEVRDAEKARKLVLEKEAKALEKAAANIIKLAEKQVKAKEAAHLRDLKKAETLRLKQVKATEALQECEAKAIAAEAEKLTSEKGGRKRVSPEPASSGRTRTRQKVTIGADKENTSGAMSDPDHSTYIRTSPVSPARKESSHQHPWPNPRYKPRTSPVDRGNLDLEFHESLTSSERNPGSPQRPADNQITGTGTDMVLDMD